MIFEILEELFKMILQFKNILLNAKKKILCEEVIVASYLFINYIYEKLLIKK